MFCRQCGIQNPDGARFCKSCGTPLQVNNMNGDQPTQQVAPQPVQRPLQRVVPQPPAREKKPFNMKILVVIAESLVLIGIIVAFFQVGGNMSEPKKSVEKFGKAIVEKDYSTAYSYFVNMPDSPYLSETEYTSAMNSHYGSLDISNYEITTDDLSANDKAVYFTYKDRSGSVLEMEKMPIRKSDKKIFFFFPSWEVEPGDIIATDYKVYANVSSTVTFDGIQLTEESTAADDSMAEYYPYMYQVPQFFKGDHAVVGSAGQWGDYNGTVNENTGLSCIDYALTDDTKEAAKQRVTDIMNIIINAAYSNAPVTGLDGFLTPDALAQVDEYYKNVQASFMPWDPIDLKILSGQGAVSEVSLYDETQDVLKFSFSGSGSTLCKYRPFEGEKKKKEECSSNVYGYAEISFVDGQWMISSISEY